MMLHSQRMMLLKIRVLKTVNLRMQRLRASLKLMFRLPRSTSCGFHRFQFSQAITQLQIQMLAKLLLRLQLLSRRVQLRKPPLRQVQLILQPRHLPLRQVPLILQPRHLRPLQLRQVHLVVLLRHHLVRLLLQLKGLLRKLQLRVLQVMVVRCQRPQLDEHQLEL